MTAVTSCGAARPGHVRLLRVAAKNDSVYATAPTRVKYKSISIGSDNLLIIDATDGTIQRRITPCTIPLIGHSMYSNKVSIALDRSNRLSVHVNESAGRCAALIDVASGRIVSEEIQRQSLPTLGD